MKWCSWSAVQWSVELAFEKQAKGPYKRDDILQKRPVILSSDVQWSACPLFSLHPYVWIHC